MKLSFSFLPESIQYTRIDDNSSTERRRPRLISWFGKAATGFVICSVVALVSGFIGLYFGKQLQHSPPNDWLAPAGTINSTFHYRKQFAAEPTNRTGKIWEIMFPKGRGFIRKDDIANGEIRGVAVFHQLHCLDGLRRGYYAALKSQSPSVHADPAHMRHCIDYLRQSLLCCADTNLEHVDPNLKGTTGWGFPRKCRDIVRIKDWAEEWRTHNQTGIL
ncbi:MAG: hypothetical protein Q9187_004463 [Circinaria calcarea]